MVYKEEIHRIIWIGRNAIIMSNYLDNKTGPGSSFYEYYECCVKFNMSIKNEIYNE